MALAINTSLSGDFFGHTNFVRRSRQRSVPANPSVEKTQPTCLLFENQMICPEAWRKLGRDAGLRMTPAGAIGPGSVWLALRRELSARRTGDPCQLVGDSRLSLIRASPMVNCQSMIDSLQFRFRSHAAVS